MIIYPVKKIYITQYFGENPQNYPKTGGHSGIDFGGKEGDLIYASASGIVEKIAYDEKGYGNYIIIKHDNHYKTLYGHLLRVNPLINEGNSIEAGTIIGYMGSTGWSTGVHLHFELRYNNKPINPIGYFTAIEFSRVRKTIPALNLRKTPEIKSDNLFGVLYSNDTFKVLEQNNEWVKIKLDQEVWVYKAYLEEVKDAV